ncbi:MAG TPA: protein-L-isoaspartate(D-aspartate) O-methyltransferase [Bryobacteraceae bacterium]|nr:protein-L-isoaspartate(D-aspartate) O-methyltransferase [Bryobacteraceae bacterium]
MRAQHRAMRTLYALAGAAATAVAIPLLFAQDYRAQRERLVRESMQGRGISNPAVLKAMRETPRHEFMPLDVRQFAYEDRPVPIGHEQTISQPSLVAFMTETLDIRKDHRVLEIGSGSGYQAAILAALAKEVYTIEIVPALARSAAATFRRLNYRNIVAREGNGYAGWPDKAPFDRIILTAAPPELPQALVDQLKPGGRLVAPVGRTPLEQELIVVDKSAAGKITRRSVLPVRFVPMVDKAPSKP